MPCPTFLQTVSDEAPGLIATIKRNGLSPDSLMVQKPDVIAEAIEACRWCDQSPECVADEPAEALACPIAPTVFDMKTLT